NKDEIDRVVRDAEAHAADDRRRREEADARNQADGLVYQTEKMLKDQAASFSGDEKEKVEADLAEVKTALAGSDVEAIKSSTEKLAVDVQELGKKLYEQAAATTDGSAGGAGGSAGGAGQGGSSAAPNDEEVVDAEVVDEGKAQ
ncbi:MAG: Hsp70 family protein, partial [Acidimicrobiales bacterium]